MEQEIERIECVGADGTRYTVIVIQQFRTFRPLSGPIQKVKGLKRLELPDGSPVNYIDDDSYKIVMTDEIIRRA